MICIAEIKTVDIDRDTFEIFHTNHAEPFAPFIGDKIERVSVNSEMIHGERFINAKGETVCIGMAKNVQEAIGLPFKAFNKMSKDIGELRRTVKDIRNEVVLIESKYQECQNQIEEFRKAGAWRRLKYLFCGWRET